ncbi:MAG: hypothetical protein ABSB09_01900 [Acidimicrobiales bacterium]|jgi:hypothetical protein
MSKVRQFNDWFAAKLTAGVGTMWCAIESLVLALGQQIEDED